MSGPKGTADEDMLDSAFAPSETTQVNPPEGEALVEDQKTDQAEQQEQPQRQPKRSMLDDLREERARRRELESWRKEAEAREQRYLEIVERVQRGSQPQRQHSEERHRPDLFEDPDGALNHITSSMEQRLIDRTVAMSEAFHRRQHGDEKVDVALRAAKQAGIAPHFQYAPDPFGALMDWHVKVSALQTIGSDPEAWRKSEREKLKAELIDELKKGGGQFRGPNEQQRFPGTLADATAQGQQGAHLNAETVLDDVFRRK